MWYFFNTWKFELQTKEHCVIQSNFAQWSVFNCMYGPDSQHCNINNPAQRHAAAQSMQYSTTMQQYVYSLQSTVLPSTATSLQLQLGQVWSGLVWSSLVLKYNMQFDSTVRLNLLKARLSQSTSYSGSTFMFLFVSQPAISQSVQHPFFDWLLRVRNQNILSRNTGLQSRTLSHTDWPSPGVWFDNKFAQSSKLVQNSKPDLLFFRIVARHGTPTLSCVSSTSIAMSTQPSGLNVTLGAAYSWQTTAEEGEQVLLLLLLLLPAAPVGVEEGPEAGNLMANAISPEVSTSLPVAAVPSAFFSACSFKLLMRVLWKVSCKLFLLDLSHIPVTQQGGLYDLTAAPITFCSNGLWSNTGSCSLMCLSAIDLQQSPVAFAFMTTEWWIGYFEVQSMPHSLSDRVTYGDWTSD